MNEIDRMYLVEQANLALTLEWGTEEQINAENRFFEIVEKNVEHNVWAAIEDYAMKATTKERIIYALSRL